MIFGTFQVSDINAGKTTVDRVSYDFPELILHPVRSGSFSGGFLTHPRLPYSQEDYLFCDESLDILVLLSGAVYNRKELYDSVQVADTITDPELIGRLFLRYGEKFITLLNGDFSIFIHREKRGESFLIRDHIGIRPVGWIFEGGKLTFSSDMHGLCRLFSGSRSADKNFLLGHLKYNDKRILPDPAVKKLLPGHCLKVTSGGVETMKYWHPEKIKTDRKMSFDFMTGRLAYLLRDAVAIRTDARFTAGAHISGGIDSGVVSALARKEYDRQNVFYGFSWTPGQFNPPPVKYDEREIIRKGCLEAGLEPVFSEMVPGQLYDLLTAFYFNRGFFSEEITISQASGLGVNLLFSGWGGDEFISTGDRALEIDLLRNFRFGLYLRRNPVRPVRRFLKNQLYFVLFPAIGILGKVYKSSFRKEAMYVRREFRKSEREAIRNFYFHISRRQMHLRMLDFYHLPERCEIWAVNGYRRGVEYRYPLLDKRIVEFMVSVPSELICRMDGFRPLIREISKGLLSDVIRLHQFKEDHVYREFLNEAYRDAAGKLLDRIGELRKNSDLDFIDLRLLEEDIERYRSGDKGLDRKLFERLLVFIMGMHEYSVHYGRETVV